MERDIKKKKLKNTLLLLLLLLLSCSYYTVAAKHEKTGIKVKKKKTCACEWDGGEGREHGQATRIYIFIGIQCAAAV